MAVDLFFAKDVVPRESSSRANGFRNRNYATSGSSGTHLKSADVCMISDDEDDIAVLNGSNKNNSIIASPKPKMSRVLTRTTQSSSNPGNGIGYANDEEVRAPIPSTRGPIVYHTYSQQYGTTNGQPHSVFNQDVLDFRQESGQPNSLQSLFRPPVDIMFVGNWEAAKAVSTKEGKWLLVNIQDVQEFSCQTLNRDVLANSGVKELIRTNFIFWQILHNAVDGERLRNYYNIQSFPAMFIVDPRTGELVTYITLKRQDAVTFCDQYMPDVDELLNKNTKTLSVVDKDEWIKKVLELYISGQGLSPHEHSFILSFPRREFSVEHTDRSLRELGFARNELVHVELK
uniref:UAS domain-containing protein n=1 Tax=Heterorhabditis bacteriophora TaxID=37862 RepID=A0A1I7X4H5_HETBA